MNYGHIITKVNRFNIRISRLLAMLELHVFACVH